MYLTNLTSHIRDHIVDVIEKSLKKLDREFSEHDAEKLAFFFYPVASDLFIGAIKPNGTLVHCYTNHEMESIRYLAEEGHINLMDLASLADELAQLAELPEWQYKLSMNVAVIEHKHGTNIYASLSEETNDKQLAAYAREYGEDEWKDLPDEEVIELYFSEENQSYGEFMTYDTHLLEL